MFTRDEALSLWDDLLAHEDAFLFRFGEMVFTRFNKTSPLASHLSNKDPFGYFIRAKNHCYTQEMFEAYNQVCLNHNATYRIECEGEQTGIFFYKKKV